jgi:putative thymidine phosphorylase
LKLKVKPLTWSAGRPVAIIHKRLAEHMSLHLNDRIFIVKGSRKIICVLDLSESMVTQEEIAVSSEVIDHLRLRKKDRVAIKMTSKPRSLHYIHKKISGKELERKEILEIIRDIVNNALTQAEVAYFVSAVYNKGMSDKETKSLIQAIAESGTKLKFKKRIVADKHSIGGVAGNRTTPIVVSICSSTGLLIPKTSSRAITSAAGTADVVECLAPVEFNKKQIMKIIKKTNACMVWGGSLGLAPADDKLIQVEKLLNIDPEPQLIASILAKKISVSATHVLIDIPCGKSAKVSKKKAKHLALKFKKFGNDFGLKIKCILTDGSSPIGNGIGPNLEIKDILKVLRQEEKRPLDLEKKSVRLAGEILELTGKSKKGKGIKKAKEFLSSGEAFTKFKQIIESQGGRIKPLAVSKFEKDII